MICCNSTCNSCDNDYFDKQNYVTMSLYYNTTSINQITTIIDSIKLCIVCLPQIKMHLAIPFRQQLTNGPTKLNVSVRYMLIQRRKHKQMLTLQNFSFDSTFCNKLYKCNQLYLFVRFMILGSLTVKCNQFVKIC